LGRIEYPWRSFIINPCFGKIPSLESSLRKLSDKLMPFKAIIGIALLVLGILGLF